MADAPAGIVKVTDWRALRKVVFYDNDYKCSYVNNSAELARAFIDSGGFTPVSAFQLREWMKAQVEGGADGSICFFSQDIVPDMVAATASADCLLMYYVRSGGRVVWVGDIPFYYQGRRGRLVENWGIKGQKAILGLDSIWDLKEEVRVTEAGREWGLTAPDKPSRCVPAEVVTALTTTGKYAVSFFKNYNSNFPQSGFLRLWEDFPIKDLLRAAQHGIEELDDEGGIPEAFQAPAAAGGGVLVGSGSFVVDRQRALDKLMRFQLPDPETCLLPIIRCALAGKASAISIQELPNNGLEIKFDGAPFSKERLADPYAALFETKTAENAAARHLATGLLCALRLKPQLITVSAGPAGSRYRLKIEELGGEVVQPSENPGKGVVLKIVWRGVVTEFKNQPLLSQVRARCALSPVPVLINNKDIPRSAAWALAAGDGIYFEEGSLNGFISVPKWPSASSSLAVSVNNVMLDTALTLRLPYLQVSGYLNNDDFTMNISQTGVVNNSRCATSVAAVARHIPGLLDQILRRQEKDLPEAGKVIAYGGMRKHWENCIESGPPLAPGLMDGLLKGVRNLLLPEGWAASVNREKAERIVREAARVTMWLREACGRLLSEYQKDSSDQVLKSLWEAPVFLTINSEARSMKQVDDQRQKMGFVPYSREQYPDSALPFDVLWCSGPKDLELISRWDTADLTVKIPHYGVNPAVAEEYMGGGAGLRLLAARHNLYIASGVRKSSRDMQPVEIYLSDIKVPELAPKKPAPPPPSAAPVVPVRVVSSYKSSMPPPPPPPTPAPPLPTEAQLAEDPAFHFPEYLSRQALLIKANGAKLVSEFITEQARDGKWMKNPLAAAVLDSPLPPTQKADYLLSVFYTDFNRRMVKLTDSDDINFQQALAELIQRGEKKQ